MEIWILLTKSYLRRKNSKFRLSILQFENWAGIFLMKNGYNLVTPFKDSAMRRLNIHEAALAKIGLLFFFICLSFPIIVTFGAPLRSAKVRNRWGWWFWNLILQTQFLRLNLMTRIFAYHTYFILLPKVKVLNLL